MRRMIKEIFSVLKISPFANSLAFLILCVYIVGGVYLWYHPQDVWRDKTPQEKYGYCITLKSLVYFLWDPTKNDLTVKYKKR